MNTRYAWIVAIDVQNGATNTRYAAKWGDEHQIRDLICKKINALSFDSPG